MGWTDRERDVAKLTAEGMTTREISEALQLSQKEVARCLRVVFRMAQDGDADRESG